MPLYEYVCKACDTKFAQLRPVSRMDDLARCPTGHNKGRRVLSTFATLNGDAGGEAEPMGGGGCGGGCTNCNCSAN